MGTTKPRVNVVLDPCDYEDLEALARESGKSLSEQVRGMVLKMLELLEDRALARLADERRRTFSQKKALSHKQVWGKRSPRRRR